MCPSESSRFFNANEVLGTNNECASTEKPVGLTTYTLQSVLYKCCTHKLYCTPNNIKIFKYIKTTTCRRLWSKSPRDQNSVSGWTTGSLLLSCHWSDYVWNRFFWRHPTYDDDTSPFPPRSLDILCCGERGEEGLDPQQRPQPFFTAASGFS